MGNFRINIADFFQQGSRRLKRDKFGSLQIHPNEIDRADLKLFTKVVETCAIDFDLVLKIGFHRIVARGDEKRAGSRISILPGGDGSRRIDGVEGAPSGMGVYRLVDQGNPGLRRKIAAAFLERPRIAFYRDNAGVWEKAGKLQSLKSVPRTDIENNPQSREVDAPNAQKFHQLLYHSAAFADAQ